MNKSFPHLHCHSEYSFLDVYGSLDKHLKRASELGMEFFCLTDHGTMRGVYNFIKLCEKFSLKFVIGCEMYWKHNLQDKQEKRKHLIVIAKTLNGLKNLIKLNNLSWCNFFDRKPLIDFSTLIQYKEGLIISTACLNGVVNKDNKDFLDDVIFLYENFGDDFYLEMMLNTIPEQQNINQLCLVLSEKLGANLLITGDTHYPLKEDKEYHDLIKCVGYGKTWKEKESISYEGNTYYLFNLDEAYNLKNKYHSYIDDKIFENCIRNAWNIVDQVSYEGFKFDKFQNNLPDVLELNFFEELQKGWVEKGLDLLSNNTKQIYLNRLEHEVNIVLDKKFDNYFLLVKLIYDFAKANNILYGVGRGSSAGSLISYLLDITNVDPIKYNLMFERFISTSRIDLPDIDMDFGDKDREKIFLFLKNKFGEDNVIRISNMGKLRGKVALKDVGRVMEVPFKEINEITDLVAERSTGDERVNDCISDSMEDNEILQKFQQKYPLVVDYSSKIEGQIKGVGIHASGVLVVNSDKKDFLILETTGSDSGSKRETISALDMYGVQDLGFVKFDVLGLKTLTMIQDIVNMIKERYQKYIDIRNLQPDDNKVVEEYNKGNFSGIFQFDSYSAIANSKKFQFRTFNDLVVFLALDRPGTLQSGIMDQYVERERSKYIPGIHPIYDKICRDTLGTIIFQEQIIKLLVDLAGYSAEEADEVRKKIGKKLGAEQMNKERGKFVEGCQKNKLTEIVANEIFDKIVFSGNYSFNKSHSVCYALLSYWCMYLKYYYPLEFYCCLFNNCTDEKKFNDIIYEIKKIKSIEILPPHVNYSTNKFIIKNNKIIAALTCIKNISESLVLKIVKHQPFNSFNDFIKLMTVKSINIKQLTSLVLGGALKNLMTVKYWVYEGGEDAYIQWRKSEDMKQVKLLENKFLKDDFDISDEIDDVELFKNSIEYNKFFNCAGIFEKLNDFCEINKIPLDFNGHFFYLPCILLDKKSNYRNSEGEVDYNNESGILKVISESGINYKIKVSQEVYSIIKDDLEVNQPCFLYLKKYSYLGNNYFNLLYGLPINFTSENWISYDFLHKDKLTSLNSLPDGVHKVILRVININITSQWVVVCFKGDDGCKDVLVHFVERAKYKNEYQLGEIWVGKVKVEEGKINIVKILGKKLLDK